MEKFKCNLNGCCCKDLKKNLNSNDYEVYLKCNRNGPFYYFLKPEEWSLPLDEHEVKILQELAEKLKIELKIAPHFFAYDLEKDFGLVLMWNLDHDVCPFLKNNKCIIYENRPLHCKMYPLAHLPSPKIQGHFLAKCSESNSDLFPKQATLKKYNDLIMNYFGEDVLFNAYLKEDTWSYYALLARELTNRRYFKPVKNRPLDFFRKKIKQKNLKGVEEFILENNINEFKKIVENRDNELNLEQTRKNYYQNSKEQDDQ